MESTKLLYLEDFTLLESDSKVIRVEKEGEKEFVILDQTVFYPQGGGQPYDTGVIESARGKFLVTEVRFIEGIVRHIGRFNHGSFSQEETVHSVVDQERRKLNSRLHSAGHVVDMALAELKADWIPGKGFHFPEGPYVEYTGTLIEGEKESLKSAVEARCNEFIQKDIETKLLFVNKSEMKSVYRFVPDYLPEGKPGRVVMYGDFGVPCGGTHVRRLSEIGHLMIRKLKQEGQIVRVAYNI